MSSTSMISVEVLAATFEEWKNGHGKALIIIKSVSAIISMISSALLVRVIFKSKDRLATTYHRLLVGMSTSDFVYSLSLAHFATMSPSDLSYMEWNASGSKATCDAMGFLQYTGGVSGLLYMVTLNLYFLVKVRYNQTDDCIRTRIEPFLHGVPVAMALLFSTIFLLTNHYNDDGGGSCHVPVHDPPHCIGYEDGQVREGFDIPCGRGSEGATPVYLMWMIFILVPPIIMGTSLWSIYRFVSVQEKKNARYAGASSNGATEGDDGGNDGIVGIGRLLSFILSPFKRRRKPVLSNSNHDNLGRLVAQKALAYAMTYPLTWGWHFIGAILGMTGVQNNNTLDMSNWQLAWMYMLNFFNPLQGLFTLLIFMHPDVMKAKRSGNTSLLWAFILALQSSVTGGNKNSLVADRSSTRGLNSNSKKSNGVAKSNVSAAQLESTASCTDPESGTNNLAKDLIFDEEMSHCKHEQSFNTEEEKTEIQAPLGSFNN